MLVAMAEASEPERCRVDGGFGSRGDGGDRGDSRGGGDEGDEVAATKVAAGDEGRWQGDSAVAALGRAKV